MRSDGMGRSAWEPQFLAVAEQDDEPDSAESALGQLRELISVMRLFKAGGIGLGPYAFAPTAEGHWRRIPTGAPATRPGGYRLNEDEAASLAAFATELEARPDPDGALSWAVARFEMGCGRESAMEGLSDHLLSLRAVLDGHGPVGASLPMRASALMADEGCDRIEARGRVERALELERALMNGNPIHGGLDVAAWIEEGARGMLREAALGSLGTDLTAAADESLIATGLAEGDAEIAVTAISSPEPPVDASPEVPAVAAAKTPDVEVPAAPAAPATPAAFDVPEFDLDIRGVSSQTSAEQSFEHEEEAMDDAETRIMEPVPAADEIKITATNWLDEVEVEVEESTLDFPAVERDIAHRERVDTPRVRHLFPGPDDADWKVRELEYDHYRHNAG
jgi:hypothetical protein